MPSLRSLHRAAVSRGLYEVSLASAACLALLALRVHYAGKTSFTFLAWNLALAWVPWVLSAAMVGAARTAAGRTLLPLLAAGWLAFLPNAPYLLTDLIHLKHRPPVPHWYDTGMLGLFGCTGLLLGIRSLAHVHGLVRRALGAAAGWLFAAQIALLCGLGIYVGRFLRWNSWDLAHRPGAMLADLGRRLLRPDLHPQTWGVTLVFGLGMLAMYVAARPADPGVRPG